MLEDLIHGARDYWATIMGFFLAFFMAIWRTAKKTGKADYLEGLMCAGFAAGFSFIPEFFGMNEKATIAVAAYIGYIGTHKFSAYISAKMGF